MSHIILLVEDNDDIRMLLADVLRRHGHRVLTAANGAEAIEVSRETPPSLVLLDLQMPVMDGATFLEHQPSVPWLAEVPVVILSAERQPPTPLPATVKRVETKPVAAELILALIDDVCGTALSSRNTTKSTLTIGGGAAATPARMTPDVDTPQTELSLAAAAPAVPDTSPIGEPPAAGTETDDGRLPVGDPPP